MRPTGEDQQPEERHEETENCHRDHVCLGVVRQDVRRCNQAQHQTAKDLRGEHNEIKFHIENPSLFLELELLDLNILLYSNRKNITIELL